MSIVRSLTAAAAVGLSLLPLQVSAQGSSPTATSTEGPPITIGGMPVSGEIGAGFAWQSNTSAYFGRYNGHPDKGFYGLGSIDVHGGDAWDSGGTFYWGLEGYDLGFDTRSITARVGQQGTWGLTVYYDGIPYWYSKDMRSVWNGDGSLVRGVAPGSVTNATRLGNLLATDQIHTQRDIFGLNGVYHWGDWTITGGVKHEHKYGSKENSVYFGSAPVSPTTANITTGAFGYFAEPIEYNTDRYDIAAEYDRQQYQVRLSYTFSNFQNDNTFIRLANPFAFTTGYGGPASRISAIYALPPSNSAHQVRAQFAYNFTPTTRLNANFQYGLSLQNDTIPPGSGNLNLINPTLPRSSLEGALQSIYGNIALVTMPIPKLDVRVSYTIDHRSNLTPRSSYPSFLADTTTLDDDFNVPYSYEHQTAKIEAGYRLAPETRLSAHYAYEVTNRTYADTNNVTENTAGLKLRSGILEGLYGSVSYTHSARVSHNYNPNGYWIGIEPDTTGVKDFTGFVKYFEADRQRDEVKASLDYAPLRNVDSMLFVAYRSDRYPSSTLGLHNNHNLAVGPDIGWRIGNGISVHGYYTYERYFFDQSAVYWPGSGACDSNGVTLTATCNGLWSAKTTDDNHAAGISLEWQAIPNLLKFNADYQFNYGNTAYSLANGGLFALGGTANASMLVAPGPTVRSTLHTITLRGEYNIRPNMTLVGGYTYANFNTNDYAYNQTATQFTNALFPGESRPDYTVHMILAMLRYRF